MAWEAWRTCAEWNGPDLCDGADHSPAAEARMFGFVIRSDLRGFRDTARANLRGIADEAGPLNRFAWSISTRSKSCGSAGPRRFDERVSRTESTDWQLQATADGPRAEVERPRPVHSRP